jgi:CBS-domain-containing membrane protein
MFAIYNNGSVGFRSTADNLYSLKHIDEASESRLKPDEGFIQNLSEHKKGSQKDSESLNTYKKMANIDMSEPVYEVKDIMNKDLVCIDMQSTLQEAYELLEKHEITQMPIISSDKTIMGLINKKTLLSLIMNDIEHVLSTLNKKLEDVILSEVITTDPISDIRRVAKVMIDFKLHAIPVVDEEGVLLGIVSKTDLLKAISKLPKLQLWS